MHPWEIYSTTNNLRNCFGNANYNDEALKKCVHLETFYDWLNECDHCCNRDICEQYAEKPEIKIDTSSLEYIATDARGRPIPTYLDFGNGQLAWNSSNDTWSITYV